MNPVCTAAFDIFPLHCRITHLKNILKRKAKTYQINCFYIYVHFMNKIPLNGTKISSLNTTILDSLKKSKEQSQIHHSLKLTYLMATQTKICSLPSFPTDSASSLILDRSLENVQNCSRSASDLRFALGLAIDCAI